MFPDFTELERLRYRQGQRLLSRDFRDQAAIDAQLRWWHNRALHNAYGIAHGLDATMSTDGGQLVVEIASGVAYDCFGRELIVQEPRTVRVPDEAENLALLLRYRDGPTHPPGSRAVCIPASGAVVNASELMWKSSDGLTFKDGVIVCRRPYETIASITLPVTMRGLVLGALPGKVTYEENALAVRGVMSREERDTLLALPLGETSGLKGLDLAAYRAAIFDLFERSQIDYGRSKGGPLARPRIANGATIAGSTAWIPWRELGQRLIGLQVDVDTSAAGFTQTPCYFASLQGAPSSGASLLTTIFEHTDLASSKGFVFRFWALILLQSLAFEKDQEGSLLALAQKLKLSVRWWGVEHDAAVEGAVAP